MSGTAAMSHRIRYRKPSSNVQIRKGRGWKKKAQLVAPAAPFIQVSAAGGGIVKILLTRGYSNFDILSTIVEWSLDGSTGWTATSLTGYTIGDTLLTTAVIATGLKYFRVRYTDTFGTGANSNTPSVTIT